MTAEWTWELWDTASNNLLASFPSERAGLVYLWRMIVTDGIDAVIDLALGFSGDENSVVRDLALAQRAFNTALSEARVRTGAA